DADEVEDSSMGIGILGALLALGALLVVVVVIVGLFFWYRRSKKRQSQLPNGRQSNAGPIDPRDATPVEELRTQDGSALIQADDAIKVAEQEIGFAQASYGDESVEMFQQDVVQAKEHMRQSFQLQHQLDDHIPDTEEEQRSWLKEI